MNARPSAAAPIVTMLAIALPLMLAGLYVGGYCWLPVTKQWRSVTDGQLASVERVYRQPILETLFKPGASVETWLRGVDVTVTYRPPGLE